MSKKAIIYIYKNYGDKNKTIVSRVSEPSYWQRFLSDNIRCLGDVGNHHWKKDKLAHYFGEI